MEVNRNPNPSLPEEIICNILLRLPVKALLKLRSVSKIWFSLISSPQFIKFHLSKSIENTHSDHHKLMLSFSYPCYLKTCYVYSLNEPFSVAMELDYPFKDQYLCWFLGSCNGLLCLIDMGGDMCLWNPSTRKSRLFDSDEILICENRFGFGYDEFNDDYKVFVISCSYGGDVCESQVKVYSSNYDCWKRIENFPYSRPFDLYGKFTNGALHWIAKHDRNFISSDSWIIVSLDVKNETYGEVPQPKYGEGKYDLTLGILNGYLSILCSYEGSGAHIWIMKEYGVKESWTKLVTIPYMDGLSSYDYLTPLHVYVNGDILLECNGFIQLYSSKDKKFRNLVCSDFSNFIEAGIYIESLVSPVCKAVLRGNNRE